MPTSDHSEVDERIGSAEIDVGKETVREARDEPRSWKMSRDQPRRQDTQRWLSRVIHRPMMTVAGMKLPPDSLRRGGTARPAL